MTDRFPIVGDSSYAVLTHGGASYVTFEETPDLGAQVTIQINDLGLVINALVEVHNERTDTDHHLSVSRLRDQVRPDAQSEQHDTERVPELDRGDGTSVSDRNTGVFFEGTPVYEHTPFVGTWICVGDLPGEGRNRSRATGHDRDDMLREMSRLTRDYRANYRGGVTQIYLSSESYTMYRDLIRENGLRETRHPEFQGIPIVYDPALGDDNPPENRVYAIRGTEAGQDYRNRPIGLDSLIVDDPVGPGGEVTADNFVFSGGNYRFTEGGVVRVDDSPRAEPVRSDGERVERDLSGRVINRTEGD